MQRLVSWWCDLIAVSDPMAIQVATGVIAGGSLILVRDLDIQHIFLVLGSKSKIDDPQPIPTASCGLAQFFN
jgi:hypothetical protein